MTRNPNWIVAVWPPENLAILNYQWEMAIRYWADLVTEAQRSGVRQIALENHACQLVYNPPMLHRLREAVGDDMVGANLDPSHAFWMGAPIAMVDALGEAIYHVHGKDADVRAPAATRTVLETEPNDHVESRAWSYVAGDAAMTSSGGISSFGAAWGGIRRCREHRARGLLAGPADRDSDQRTHLATAMA